MNKIKKPISLLLVLVMCLSFLPTAALADVVAEAAHTHNEGGWTCVEQPKLICEVEEHTHDDSCWQAGEQTLTCGLEESEDHHHSEECYTPGERTLVCELEEHTHTDTCYKTEWTCTAPVETEGTAEETEGETKEPAEGTEAEIPEGADVLSAKSLWKYARAYNGKAMNMPQFFGLVQTDSQQKWPASLTFVGEDVDEEVLLEDAITCGAEVAVADENTITFDGTEVTVYYYSEDMTAKKPSWFRDDGMYSIKDDKQDAVTFQFYATEDATGEPLAKDQILTADKKTLQVPAAPEKQRENDSAPYYVFEKWVVLDTETVITAGEQDLTGYNADSTVKVVPVFGEYWHVTFENADGTVAYVAAVKKGEALSDEDVEKANLAYVPATAGNTVDGWTYDPALADGKPTANVTATAAQEKSGVWVEFDSDGGTPVNAKYPNAEGYVTDIPGAETMKRPGFTFQGWYLEDGTQFTSETKVTSVLKVKARWEAGTAIYTIQYFIENADDNGYTYAGSTSETGNVGDSLSKTDAELQSAGRVQIRANMTGVDQNQFSYDSVAKVKTVADNADRVIAGDGTTVFNVYLSRAKYTLKFQSGPRNNAKVYKTYTRKYDQYIGDVWDEVKSTPS